MNSLNILLTLVTVEIANFMIVVYLFQYYIRTNKPSFFKKIVFCLILSKKYQLSKTNKTVMTCIFTTFEKYQNTKKSNPKVKVK